MEVFVLRLDPDTREDMYADDVHEYFMDFVLLEALIITVKDFINDPERMAEANEDPHFYINDPDSDIAASIEFLLDVLKEFDKADGRDVEAEGYCLQEFHGMVADKLSLAISSITSANKAFDLITMYRALQQPDFVMGISCKGRHLGDTVVLQVTGRSEPKFI